MSMTGGEGVTRSADHSRAKMLIVATFTYSRQNGR
jgi:hypothetical protein